MIQLIFLTIAAAALLLDLIFTIYEIILYYHLHYSCGAHPGRIRGASVPRAREGSGREVEWIIKDGIYIKEGSAADE